MENEGLGWDPPEVFNGWPLKSYRNPIGKDRNLPTIIFQGRAVKLREGNPGGGRGQIQNMRKSNWITFRDNK